MTGKNSILNGGGFHHVAIRSHDFDNSVRFYTHALGFTTQIAWGEKPKRAVMLDTGDGNYLEIFERLPQVNPPVKPAMASPVGGDEPPILHFAIRTGDTEAAIARARAAGAVVTMEPKHVDIQTTNGQGTVPVYIAFCTAPDGTVIEFFQNDRT
ncbi:MAG: VOC family protein [Phycisphaerales bacterium]